MAASVFLMSAFLVGAEFKQSTSYLFAGLLPVYLMVSSYMSLRFVNWLDARKAFSRLLAVLTSAGLLLTLSWVVFGAYFVTAARLGYESTEHLGLEILVRKALQVQIGLIPLLCALLVRKEGKIDLVVSLIVAVLIMVIAIF